MRLFKNRRLRYQNDVDTPTIEVFGSALALLIIIFILASFINTKNIVAMIDRSTEGAKHKVVYEDGSEGFVVLTYSSKIRILETNETIAKDNICLSGSPFIKYIEKIYHNKKQIIFAISDNSVSTMAVARECLRTRFLNRSVNIAWIIANKDLLSSVRLQDLPAHIKRSIAP